MYLIMVCSLTKALEKPVWREGSKKKLLGGRDSRGKVIKKAAFQNERIVLASKHIH